jgi:hypothetical protein
MIKEIKDNTLSKFEEIKLNPSSNSFDMFLSASKIVKSEEERKLMFSWLK